MTQINKTEFGVGNCCRIQNLEKSSIYDVFPKNIIEFGMLVRISGATEEKSYDFLQNTEFAKK